MTFTITLDGLLHVGGYVLTFGVGMIAGIVFALGGGGFR